MERSVLRSGLVLAATAMLAGACTSLLGDFSIDQTSTGDGGGGGSASASGGGGSGGDSSSGGGGGGTGGAEPCSNPATCDPGYGDCDCDKICEPVQGNGANDPYNCGACGKSCEGGQCNLGKCAPVLVPGGDISPAGIVVDASHIYWADQASGSSGTILKTPVVTPDPEPELMPFVSGQSQPLYLAIGQGYLYWTVRGVGLVQRIPLVGGEPEPVDSGKAPAGIATDSTHVYWTGDNPGGVYRKALGNSGSTETLVSGQLEAYGMALDQNNVYWVTRAALGTVMARPKAGGAPVPIAIDQNLPRSVASDGTSVYWANEGSQDVWRADTDGANPQLVYNGMPRGEVPRDIAVDETGVYWTDSSAGGVYRYDPSTGAVDKIAGGALSEGIFLDAKRIYWTTTAGVYKLVK